MSNKEFEIEKLGECRYESPIHETIFVDDNDGILVDATLSVCKACSGNPEYMELAGPRKQIYFSPSSVTAGVVTCGGLCPGLNDVIRTIVMVLWYRYGVRRILGYRYGYKGLTPASKHPPLVLTPEIVESIHNDGGTILGTSRGPADISEIVNTLERDNVNILFTIGGDGTHRGMYEITKEISKRRLPIAVVGVPKTIDNDISYIERSFGFETAVEMSRTVITCAHMEAKGAENGIGLVKLMGRESGFIAAYATLASGDVNLTLVPEVPFSLKKVVDFMRERLIRKSHAVVVVAEGAGQNLFNIEGTDASGNKKLGDIGRLLAKTFTEELNNLKPAPSIKYIDPSYTIRSAPASADDSVFCFRLAENAVHAAMTGRTAMVVGFWNGHFVHVPVKKAIQERKKLDPSGSLWQSVLENTGQPAILL